MDDKAITLTGIHAMQWAREVSKLPDATFTLAYYPYSRTRNEASAELKVATGCKWRTQLPKERFSVDAENLLLFTDGDGNPKMCYRILIRYMGFPNDGYQLHKIQWLSNK
jgi:hypothetical protein